MEGAGRIWPNADKRGGLIFTVFFGHPLWMTPNSVDVGQNSLVWLQST